MKTTINTELLKNALAKSIKCSTNITNLPLTTLVAIEVKDNKLTLTTTNGSDYLYVTEDVEADDFYAVVNADIISKLVNRTTCATMVFNLDNDVLTVKGLGNYSIELPVDENGKLIVYPNPLAKTSVEKVGTIVKSSVDAILKSNKNALSSFNYEECYTGYFVGNKVVTCNGYKICSSDINVVNKPILVRGDTFALMEVMNSDVDVKLSKDTDEIVLKGDKCTIYGHLMNCLENFKIDDIDVLLNSELPNVCEINRSTLLKALDRLMLFVGVFDNNNISLKFTQEGLLLSNIKNNSQELIRYAYKNDIKEFVCNVDAEMFKSQLNAQSCDVVKLWYGSYTCIKLVDGITTQLLGLSAE